MAKLIKLTKQAKLVSIDEDKVDEADKGDKSDRIVDGGSWTSHRDKADEAGKIRTSKLASLTERFNREFPPSTAGPSLVGLSRMPSTPFTPFAPFTPFTPFTPFSDGSRCTKEVPPTTLRPSPRLWQESLCAKDGNDGKADASTGWKSYSDDDDMDSDSTDPEMPELCWGPEAMIAKAKRTDDAASQPTKQAKLTNATAVMIGAGK